MKDDLKNVLFSEDEIKQRVGQLGARITHDYAGASPLLLGVLKGSFIFLADLARTIELNCEIRFIAVSSYGLASFTSGRVEFDSNLDFEIARRHVILIEDILDSGETLTALRSFISGYCPASLKICSMLDKPARRKVPISADYLGFECPDEFIVGYGLDYAERYRNLPYIASLKPEIYT